MTAWSYRVAPEGLSELRLGLLSFDVPDKDVNVFDPTTLAARGRRIPAPTRPPARLALAPPPYNTGVYRRPARPK